MRICNLVASASSLDGSDDQPAPAKAREVIGHIRTSQLEVVRKLSRVTRSIQQGQEDPRPGGIRHGTAEAIHDVKARCNGQHMVTIQSRLINQRALHGGGVSSGSRLVEWNIVSLIRPGGRQPWTSLQFAYLALALNGLGVSVLIANLLTGAGWTVIAVPIAVVCLILGLTAGFQTRRLRIRERSESGR